MQKSLLSKLRAIPAAFSAESEKPASSAQLYTITSYGGVSARRRFEFRSLWQCHADRLGSPVTLLALVTLTNTGCFWIATQGPNLGPLAIPIPVSPYCQKEHEDKFWVNERYSKVPILGPITAGGPGRGLDPPSDDEVMRALEKAQADPGRLPMLARNAT